MTDNQRLQEFFDNCEEARAALLEFMRVSKKVRLTSAEEVELASFVRQYCRKYDNHILHAKRAMR